jgi:hypothetical protein
MGSVGDQTKATFICEGAERRSVFGRWVGFQEGFGLNHIRIFSKRLAVLVDDGL